MALASISSGGGAPALIASSGAGLAGIGKEYIVDP